MPRSSAATKPRTVDALIIGGGVAGLWLLDRLRRGGLGAILVGDDRGDSQTLWSQGILHRGAKYALRPGGDPFPDVGERWRAALRGAGRDPDLRAVPRLAPGVELRGPGPWPRDLLERLDGGVRRGLVERLPDAGGHRYRLLEPVLDPPALLAALAAPHRDAIVSGSVAGSAVAGGPGGPFDVDAAEQRWRARRLVLCAGAGNAALLRSLGLDGPAMVRRPLHMVRAAGPLPPTWRHQLDAGCTFEPRPGAHWTVTSHPDPAAGPAGWRWTVGGDPSEDGVDVEAAQHIDRIRGLLEGAFPAVRFDGVRFSAHRVDRAEPAPADGIRRLEPFVEQRGAVLTVWPMKLALAPLLGDRAIELLAG